MQITTVTKTLDPGAGLLGSESLTSVFLSCVTCVSYLIRVNDSFLIHKMGIMENDNTSVYYIEL